MEEREGRNIGEMVQTEVFVGGGNEKVIKEEGRSRLRTGELKVI